MGATQLNETRPLPGPRPYEMLLEFTRAKKAEDPYSFRFEPQKYRLRMKGGVTKSATFPWSEQLLEDLRTLTRAQAAPEAARRLGEHLRRFLDELDWGGHEHVLERSGRTPGVLRVVIRSAAAELYALPWEMVTLKDSGQHLADLPGCTVSYEWPSERGDIPRLPAPERPRVLFAWSAAGGMVPVERHLQTLEQVCQKRGLAFDEQQDTLPKVSLSSLDERLSGSLEPISVLHVLCHGTLLETQDSGTYGLVWNSSVEGRDKELVDGARLSALLAPYSDTLKLVVLCACHGGDGGKMASYLGSVAQELHRAGIEVVVASRLPLSAAGSVLMTETLYQKLLVEGRSLDEALCAARRRLRVAGNGFDWAALQFYARTNQPFFLGRRKQKEEPLVPAASQRQGSAASLWMDSFSGLGSSRPVGKPSEGVMITAAKMASLQGVPLVRDVTLTGIVNPDGSIGPVDGLLPKLEDAPQEVRDIYEAYELLTGQRLSRPLAVDSSAMNVSPTAFQHVQARTSGLLAHTQSSLGLLKQPSQYTPIREPLLVMASQEYTLAARYQAEGRVPAAYHRAYYAAALSDAAQALPPLADALFKPEMMEKLNKELQALASRGTDFHAHMARLVTSEPLSVARAMSLLGAYESAFLSLAEVAAFHAHITRCRELLSLHADALREHPEQTWQRLWPRFLEMQMRARLFLSMAWLQFDLSSDVLNFSAEQKQQVRLEAPSLMLLAQAYASAAQANLDSYQALMTQVEARQVDQSPIPLPDDPLVMARAMLDRTWSALRQQEGVLICLAVARASYLHSAQLITRRYSLMVEEDESGHVVTVRRNRAFMTMLELAEHKAREFAAEARETTGAVPALAQMAYQRACAQREGNTGDQLDALGHFWSASMASQLAVALAKSSQGPQR